MGGGIRRSLIVDQHSSSGREIEESRGGWTSGGILLVQVLFIYLSIYLFLFCRCSWWWWERVMASLSSLSSYAFSRSASPGWRLLRCAGIMTSCLLLALSAQLASTLSLLFRCVLFFHLMFGFLVGFRCLRFFFHPFL